MQRNLAGKCADPDLQTSSSRYLAVSVFNYYTCASRISRKLLRKQLSRTANLLAPYLPSARNFLSTIGGIPIIFPSPGGGGVPDSEGQSLITTTRFSTEGSDNDSSTSQSSAGSSCRQGRVRDFRIIRHPEKRVGGLRVLMELLGFENSHTAKFLLLGGWPIWSNRARSHRF